MKPIIKVKNLSVTYFLGKANEVKSLKNINLEIYPGEFITFFGPSGCGKSTLLYAISGLESNVEGEIYIDDNDISKLSNEELEYFHRKKTGMIFQSYYLINSLSVLKNVILPQIAVSAKSEERKKRAIKLLEHFGVKEQTDKLPNELSGGQQQRVAICRALINDPDILLADEPVGNLDSKSASDVMELLKNLNKKHKKTIILVTHNPAYLNIAHRVFYMKDGVIIKTKIKSAINEKVSSLEKGDLKLSISKELEFLARAFSDISASPGNLLLPFKAKQIVTEVLIGMTEDEISDIENKVEELLMRGLKNNDTLFRYLDDEVKNGGLGMDKRTANNLARKIRAIITEIKIIEEEDKKKNLNDNFDPDEKIKQIRHYLFSSFNVQIKNYDALNVINAAIKERLENEIDKKDFQNKLDLPLAKGGAGLDKRNAQKVARRLELLMLGKYK